jgi:tRNA (cytidine/uridine-2'-O-)-methyltransferase
VNPPVRLPSVAFFEPRIPENTGAAIRLSACTGAPLRLIEPLGFSLEESRLRRAGLDYHDLATVTVHPSFDALCEELPSARIYAFTGQAQTRYTEIGYQPGDVLLFGPEPTGLPEEVLNHARITECVRIPMLPQRRSLNLSNSAAIAIYEAARQLDFADQI